MQDCPRGEKVVINLSNALFCITNANVCGTDGKCYENVDIDPLSNFHVEAQRRSTEMRQTIQDGLRSWDCLQCEWIRLETDLSKLQKVHPCTDWFLRHVSDGVRLPDANEIHTYVDGSGGCPDEPFATWAFAVLAVTDDGAYNLVGDAGARPSPLAARFVRRCLRGRFWCS